MVDHFKQCTMCKKIWTTREDFLADRELEINGYQADFEQLEEGLFYFTHLTEGCGSTLAIQTREFLDLNSGAKYEQRNTGKEDCPGYCRQIDQLDRCKAQCECAFVRDIIQIIRQRQEGKE
ncbi:MAG: hypothetical protein D6B25_18670 [Desulfobulbaceae bacterium]|nr:MAG: hypothetical protein D6B25_18670 [Desulfobulbaceae bacterium]